MLTSQSIEASPAVSGWLFVCMWGWKE